MIYEMIIADLMFQNKLEKFGFFEEIFLLEDTNMKVVLRMFFLFLSNTSIWFAEKRID